MHKFSYAETAQTVKEKQNHQTEHFEVVQNYVLKFNVGMQVISFAISVLWTNSAVSCLFPLSDNPNFSKIIGTRHRAALGITEQTDTVVIMVSEETAEISVACDGRFIPIVNRERLVNILKDLLIQENTKKKKRLFRKEPAVSKS